MDRQLIELLAESRRPRAWSAELRQRSAHLAAWVSFAAADHRRIHGPALPSRSAALAVVHAPADTTPPGRHT